MKNHVAIIEDHYIEDCGIKFRNLVVFKRITKYRNQEHIILKNQYDICII